MVFGYELVPICPDITEQFRIVVSQRENLHNRQSARIKKLQKELNALQNAKINQERKSAEESEADRLNANTIYGGQSVCSGNQAILNANTFHEEHSNCKDEQTILNADIIDEGQCNGNKSIGTDCNQFKVDSMAECYTTPVDNEITAEEFMQSVISCSPHDFPEKITVRKSMLNVATSTGTSMLAFLSDPRQTEKENESGIEVPCSQILYPALSSIGKYLKDIRSAPTTHILAHFSPKGQDPDVTKNSVRIEYRYNSRDNKEYFQADGSLETLLPEGMDNTVDLPPVDLFFKYMDYFFNNLTGVVWWNDFIINICGDPKLRIQIHDFGFFPTTQIFLEIDNIKAIRQIRTSNHLELRAETMGGGYQWIRLAGARARCLQITRKKEFLVLHFPPYPFLDFN